MSVDGSDSARERMSPAVSILTFPEVSNFPRKAALLKVLYMSAVQDDVPVLCDICGKKGNCSVFGHIKLRRK